MPKLITQNKSTTQTQNEDNKTAILCDLSYMITLI